VALWIEAHAKMSLTRFQRAVLDETSIPSSKSYERFVFRGLEMKVKDGFCLRWVYIDCKAPIT
jgi:hypothetical protein